MLLSASVGLGTEYTKVHSMSDITVQCLFVCLFRFSQMAAVCAAS